ncbi:MAG: hypothetical protein LBJ24_05055 [Treponema sp.]|jgi:lipoyltransferase/lipoate-protein ligase|nr:hypothetical protein [Treponema sp.]
MTKRRVLRSASRCIYENLALEESIFSSLEEGEETLLLWRNRDCVVIGRYQNPYIECRLGELRRDGISLARRQSGGGTVWHDEGNLCFTFFGSGRSFSRRNNIELAAEALTGLGVPAEISPRLDILAGGCKISGSAFRESRGFSFHHGTILIRSNLEKLRAYLGGRGEPAACSPEGNGGETSPWNTDGFGHIKGIRSVPSPVRNIGPYLETDRPVEAVEAALAETFARRRFPAAAFKNRNGPAAPRNRNMPELAIIDPKTIRETSFLAYLNHIQSRDWLYGASPPFSRRCRLGRFDCTLDIRGGIIADLHIAAAEEAGNADYTETRNAAPDNRIGNSLAGADLDRLSAEDLRDLLLGRDYEDPET